MYAHPTLVATPAGVALGVVDAWLWARKPKDQPDVKESARWVEGYEIVADLAETVADTRLVFYVADREGDLRALIDVAARRGPARPAGGLADPVEARPQDDHGRKTVGAAGAERTGGRGRIHPVGGAGSSRPNGRPPGSWPIAPNRPKRPRPWARWCAFASFGGFLGRKHDGHPSPKAIWEGLQKVRAFIIAFEATRAVYAEDG